MPQQLENLRKEFAAILKLYNDILSQKTATETKISGIKDTYNELVKKNPIKSLLFCLDALFFQYKILNLELDHYNKKLALLQNRMYGDYYKLYQLMVSQTKELGIVLKGGEAAPELPIYKDIDPLYKYRIEDITTVHDHILMVLGELYKAGDIKTANIKQHRDEIAVGESLLIFINAMEYERDSLLGYIQMFSKYLEFYHQSQARYLDGIYRGILEFDASLEDSVLIRLDGGEAIASPHTESFEDDEIHMEDIYTGDGCDDAGLCVEGFNENLLSESADSAFDLDGEDSDGPILNIQPFGSQIPDASSSGTIAYIELGESGEPATLGEDYIPQTDNAVENITMEVCDTNEEMLPPPPPSPV